jgi:aminomuconate-semialdehyde/2-hydroxymuconate-6-semialdehyde dehydrogenase
MKQIRNFVNGQYVDGRSVFDDVDPATGDVVAHVHEADLAVVDAAVTAARAAMTGPWGRATVAQRASLLRRIAAGIEARFEEFVQAEAADTGKPLEVCRTMDVPRAIQNFTSFASTLEATGQASFLTEFGEGRTALNYAVRKPLGVVAVIVPWNLPLLLLTWKLGPAIGSGNAVVVKPSEETPQTATLLGEVITAAGAPSGIYNVVHGFGLDSAGSYLTEHPDIDGVTFTGSTATGSAIMRAVAGRVLPVSFELGGKNAALVFADADIEKTLDGLTRSVFFNTGQVCLCTERVYVERSIFQTIVDGLAERARGLVFGPSSGEADAGGKTTIGPLISEVHRDKVLSYYRKAEESGATIVIGGGIPELTDDRAGGFWIEPTLWTGLSHDSAPMREEVFGPVAGLIPFDTEEEAIALANDTPYGLAASVWTQDIQRGHRVAQNLRVGMAWVNTWYLRDLRSPFGGMGMSGIGREGGVHSYDFFSEPTNVCVQL